MENELYTIVLADGKILKDLELNGNNFISHTELTEADFKYNCSPVSIQNQTTNTEELHEHMELVQVTKDGDAWWFVLREVTEAERAKNKTQSDIEYIAMMAGIEL
ncbi:MAG: hypothetical protein R3Y53_00820 [Bacillota bacterium]